MITQDEAKKLAGLKAIEQFIKNGMVLGLGSGTTSHFFDFQSISEEMQACPLPRISNVAFSSVC